MQITYTNKEALQNDPEVADKNKVTAEDMNEIKTVVNTNEEELSAYIADLENNQLTGESSGQSIYLSDSANAKVRSIGLSGNSEQDGEPTPENPVEIHSTGDNVNLFDGVVTSQSATSYADGKITFASGSSTNNQIIIFSKGDCKAGETYTVSFDIISSLNGARLTFDGQPDNTTSSGYFADVAIYATTTKTRQTITGIIPEGLTGFRFFRISSMDLYATATIEISNIKIEQGNQASPYTPYGIGSVNEKVQNKNLFNKDNVTPNSWLNINGNTETNNLYVVSEFIPVIEGEQYYIPKRGSTRTKYYLADKTAYSNTWDVTDYAQAITIPNNVKYIRFTIATSGSTAVDLNTFQFEEGTTATDYVAHEEQNISIPTQQPMRAIGDYKDTFIKVDGNWYERHYIKSKILDGSETYSDFRTWGNYYRININIADAKTYSINNSNGQLSSHFHYNHEGVFAENTQSIPGIFAQFRGTTGFSFVIEQSSVANWKAWLSNNNVELIYVLATPVDLPCTEEQTEALETLEKARTYKPVTHISSEDTVPATVDLTYVKDLETVINNLGGA